MHKGYEQECGGGLAIFGKEDLFSPNLVLFTSVGQRGTFAMGQKEAYWLIPSDRSQELRGSVCPSDGRFDAAI